MVEFLRLKKYNKCLSTNWEYLGVVMIYVVEDDSSIRELIVYTLCNTGFKAKGFSNASSFFEAMKTQAPRLILLDIMMPGEDGISVLRRLRGRAATKKLPVIMITAKSAEYDKVLGLDNGADDYITKPFGMMELISRVKAVLRRSENSPDEVYTCGRVTLNAKSHTVTINGMLIDTTLKEFELLRLLMKNAGTVLTRDMLLEKVWGYDFCGETRTVDVHVRTLRAKLKDFGDIIETVRGVGYKIGDLS